MHRQRFHPCAPSLSGKGSLWFHPCLHPPGCVRSSGGPELGWAQCEQFWWPWSSSGLSVRSSGLDFGPFLAPNPPGVHQEGTFCSSCWRMWLSFPVFCSTISVAFSDSLSALHGLWTEFLTRRRKCPWTDAGSLAPRVHRRDLASTQEIAVSICVLNPV